MWEETIEAYLKLSAFKNPQEGTGGKTKSFSQGRRSESRDLNSVPSNTKEFISLE
jgi:hypothetical protein